MPGRPTEREDQQSSGVLNLLAATSWNEDARRSSAPISRSLPIARLRARETMMEPLRAILQEAGVTEQQWRILRVLEETGPLSGYELARAAGLHTTSLSRTVELMVRKDLVSRYVDLENCRRQSIALRPDGKKLIDRFAPQSRKVVQDFEARLTEKDLDNLLHLLEKVRG
ncbi:MarR family transcriptional regulator [Rhodobacterales bacterium]|nr:MarR family transcriptional regulator [Rhodobacterales bacterium]